jgi:hypothetical protein
MRVLVLFFYYVYRVAMVVVGDGDGGGAMRSELMNIHMYKKLIIISTQKNASLL